MAQRYKFSMESKSFPLYISGEPFLRVAFFKNEEIRGKKGFLPTDFLYLLCDKLPKGNLLILMP